MLEIFALGAIALISQRIWHNHELRKMVNDHGKNAAV
jgi:hypothetical protein